MSDLTVQQRFNIAVEHHQSGRLAEAQTLYQQIIREQPYHADALHLLGVLAAQSGCKSEGVEYIRRAIAINPSAEIYHNNLAQALLDQKKFDEAIVECREALRLNPNLAAVYSVLGAAQAALEMLDESAESYLQALHLTPDDPNVHNHLGNVRMSQGKLQEAIRAYESALKLKNNFPEAWNNLGKALDEKGLDAEALKAYRTALKLKPDFAQAHSNVGVILHARKQYGAAAFAYRNAIKLKSDFAMAHNNLAITLKDQGKLDEAIDAYRRALELEPDFTRSQSNLIFTMLFHPAYGIDAIHHEVKNWNQRHASPLKRFIQSHANDPDPRRRLKIGYVSGDFREHSATFFLQGLFAAHDPGQVEIFCYADLKNPDYITGRLKSFVHHWQNITGKTDSDVAEIIRRDRIDILVDLAGHTADNRLLAFARKPAPVQVTYLGYPGTTGLGTVDYRFTDAYADPPGQDDNFYSEKLIRLNNTFLCYQPSDAAPSVGPLPALKRSEAVIFGCLNMLPKINAKVVELWAQILKQTPKSRMLLKNASLSDLGAQEHLLQLFASCGIGPDRLELHGWMASSKEHLQLYNQIDLALDTFPYNGTTTTCEALWMGVPVVTLAGHIHMSRVGVSLLSNAGLPELIAQTPHEYVQIAVKLAGDLPKLNELRGTMRQRMQKSPLMDSKRFAHNVEEAYRNMWKNWCKDAIAPGKV